VLRPRLAGAPPLKGLPPTAKSISFWPPAFKRMRLLAQRNRGLLRRTMKTHFENGLFRCTLKRSGNYLTSGEPPNMSIQAHLAELERRHRVLEAEIAEAQAHPSIDDLEIVELKRRKLLVKDEIARLQVDTLVH
jgi:hypothetical protein